MVPHQVSSQKHQGEGETLHPDQEIEEELQQQEAHGPDRKGWILQDLGDKVDHIREDIRAVWEKEYHRAEKRPPEQRVETVMTAEKQEGKTQRDQRQEEIPSEVKVGADDFDRLRHRQF